MKNKEINDNNLISSDQCFSKETLETQFPFTLKYTGFTNSHLERIIIDYLKTCESANRADINKIIEPILPNTLTDKQKTAKFERLLQSLRRQGKIKKINYKSWSINKLKLP